MKLAAGISAILLGITVSKIIHVMCENVLWHLEAKYGMSQDVEVSPSSNASFCSAGVFLG